MKLRTIIAAVTLLITGTATAQQDQLIPQDPDLRIGHLDNGLTYYIRHNNYPEGKADFHMLMKNGSLQEEDSQRGLAHMLEHLAFNNTEHFPEFSLGKYIKGNGAYTNADTWFDHTNYMIVNMPVPTQERVDSLILVLKDWCNGIIPTDKVIEAERDVVHNEFRLRMVGTQRIISAADTTILAGSRYADHNAMGLMSIIDNCKPQELRDYYSKWYRPDNQAIVIVGDVDVDKVEAKIKELFGGIKVPADAAKVLLYPVPDNKDAIYYIGKDKEMTANFIEVDMKYDPTPVEQKKTVNYLVQQYLDNAVCNLLTFRYDELSQDASCPFLGAGTSTDKFRGETKTKNAFALNMNVKPGKEVEAYKVGLTELKRAYDFGFTATECKRFCDMFMNIIENKYSNRNKKKNAEFTEQYKQNFDVGTPIPSVEQYYNIMKQIAPQVSDEMINARAKELINLSDSNYVAFLLLQEKDGAKYPTVEELKAAKKDVANSKLDAYVDNVKQEPLIAKTPKAGKIVKTTENKTLGYKELKLSNGAKVILKKTDFADNELKMDAFADGGYSGFPMSQATEMRYIDNAFGGLGNFSFNELLKAIADKNVGFGFDVTRFKRTASFQSAPKNAETMMQLAYLIFTNMNKDEKNFESWRQIEMTQLANVSKDPEQVYSDSVGNVLYVGDKYNMHATADEVKALNLDHMLPIFRDLYSNAMDFTFIIVGNFDETALLPFIKTYIASIPNSGKTFKNGKNIFFTGQPVCTYTQTMANPNSHDTECWASDIMPETLRNNVLVNIAAKMLYRNYYRIIRQKLSATYTPGASHIIRLMGDGKVVYGLQSDNMLNPDKCDEALKAVEAGIQELATNPNEEDFKQAKETYLNNHDLSLKNNDYWLSTIANYLQYGFDGCTGAKEIASSITTKDISDFVNDVILKTGNHAKILMKAVKE